jgi:hypothetical protein
MKAKRKNQLNTTTDARLSASFEVSRQFKKWGYQEHTPQTWNNILDEEIQEAKEAYLNGDNKHYIQELIQVAAVGLSWLHAEANRLGIDLDQFDNMD